MELLIPDLHFPVSVPDAIAFLAHQADMHDVDRVVFVGDLVDWKAIDFHEKDPTLPNASSEWAKAKDMMQQLVEVFDDTDWVTGNHDDLPRRKMINAGLPPDILLTGVHSIYDLPETWRVVPRYGHLDMGDYIVKHGDSGRGGKEAHIKQAMDNRRSTAIGHFHTNAGVIYHNNGFDQVWGLAVGCLIDFKQPNFAYAKPHANKPVLGCAVVKNGAPMFIPYE